MAEKETMPKASDRVMQRIDALEKTLTNKKEETKMPELCPECGKAHTHTEIEFIKRDHKTELEKAVADATQARAEKDQTIKQAEAVLKGHNPPTADLFEHWETCPDCKPKLESLIGERYVKPAFTQGKESIGKDEVEAWLKANNYFPPIREISLPSRSKK